MAQPHVLLLRAPGTNCDLEAAYACERAGATTERVHIRALRNNPARLRNAQILILPGGFSYGDDVAAGKILANQLQHFFGDAVREFRDQDKLILGICNGFQALLKSGLLIPPDPDDGPVATLTCNSLGRFLDRWVTLRVTSTRSPFLDGIEQLELPVAHGEGQFVCRKTWIMQGLQQSGLIALRYADPPRDTRELPVQPERFPGRCRRDL